MFIKRSNYSLDNKGRLIVPKNSIITNKESIVFFSENSLTFSMYNLSTYIKMIKDLKSKKECALNKGQIEVCKYIDNQINLIVSSIIGEKNIDLQNRIVISENIRKMYELEKNIVLCNGIDHIKVFKNEENLEKYRNNLELKL